MIDNDKDRSLALQPVVFLIAQSFTVTTTWRDRSMFHEFDIARPTLVNVRQSLVFFVLALLLAAHVLGNIITWPAFYCVGTLWVTVSALFLSKCVRDRNYADIFQSVHEEDLKDIFEKIIGICKGSIEYQVFAYLSFATALIMLNVVNLTWNTKKEGREWNQSNKGTLFMLMFWAMTSTVHIAKLYRDRRDPNLSASMREQLPFQCMVIATWCISACSVFVCIFMLKAEDYQQFFMAVGWGFTLTSTMFLSKFLRDRREAFHIIAAAAAPYGESGLEVARSPQAIYMDQFAKGQQNGVNNGHSPRAVSSSIQPIMDLTAPLERRGQAAKLIGQRSLMNQESAYVLESDYAMNGYAEGQLQQPPKSWKGLATE
jgi:hypothetical protein